MVFFFTWVILIGGVNVSDIIHKRHLYLFFQLNGAWMCFCLFVEVVE